MRKILVVVGVLLFSFNAFSQEECPPTVKVFTYYYSKPLTADFIIDTIYACDPDVDDILTWSYDEPLGFWLFNDGEIKVGDATSLNSDTQTSYSFTVTVTDNGSPELNETATINLIETNGEPIIVANQTFSVDENLTDGTVVGTVVANDPNNQALTYTISSGNDDGLFEIDSNTGEITTTALLNFEDVSSYSLGITVTDSGTTPLTSTETIVINVSNVNEPPVIYGGE